MGMGVKNIEKNKKKDVKTILIIIMHL